MGGEYLQNFSTYLRVARTRAPRRCPIRAMPLGTMEFTRWYTAPLDGYTDCQQTALAVIFTRTFSTSARRQRRC